MERLKVPSWLGLGTATHYVSHLLMEFGRLGVDPDKFPNYDLPHHSVSTLHDLMSWISYNPNEEFARLCDWKLLDLQQMKRRMEKNRHSKPRIEVGAYINQSRNLSVKWHPAGWGKASLPTTGDYDALNKITHREWNELPDFHWFEGDEEPYFDKRASNELMYIRGVGYIDPRPNKDFLSKRKIDFFEVDAILISAVRAAYEGLLSQLGLWFEVDAVTAFDFTVCQNDASSGSSEGHFSINRVVDWTLEDASTLDKRRRIEAELMRSGRERHEIENLEGIYGFSVEQFALVARSAIVKNREKGPVNMIEVDRRIAKDLRAAGISIKSPVVSTVRKMIIKHRADMADLNDPDIERL